GQMGIAYAHWASSSLVDTRLGVLPMVSIYARLSGRRAFLTKSNLSAKTDQSNHHHPTSPPISRTSKKARFNSLLLSNTWYFVPVVVFGSQWRIGTLARKPPSIGVPINLFARPIGDVPHLRKDRDMSTRFDGRVKQRRVFSAYCRDKVSG